MRAELASGSAPRAGLLPCPAERPQPSQASFARLADWQTARRTDGRKRPEAGMRASFARMDRVPLGPQSATLPYFFLWPQVGGGGSVFMRVTGFSLSRRIAS
jgi:hypothetical protein